MVGRLSLRVQIHFPILSTCLSIAVLPLPVDRYALNRYNLWVVIYLGKRFPRLKMRHKSQKDHGINPFLPEMPLAENGAAG